MQAARRVADPAAIECQPAGQAAVASETDKKPLESGLCDGDVERSAVSAGALKPPARTSTEDGTSLEAADIGPHLGDVSIPWWYTPKRLLVGSKLFISSSDRTFLAQHQQTRLTRPVQHIDVSVRV